jgi:single-strand DNA-binding protein
MSAAKVWLYGNLGRDPELRYTQNGTPVCSFSMAVSRKRGNEEKTTWWKVTFWEKKAELANQYLSKGKAVIVEGYPELEEYVDRDGKPRAQMACQGFEMHFVGSNEDRGSGGPQQSNYQGNKQGGNQQGGGRPLGPKEAYRQAQQQKQTGGGLSLGDDDDPPF